MDGTELALRLQKDLTASGFEVWLDAQRISGGASWTAEIEEGIDRAEVVLALLTPGSYGSEICRAEQMRSLRKGKCVIPVLAAGCEIPLYFETKNYRDFTGVYDESFQLLLGDIEGRRGAGLAAGYHTTPVAFVTAPPMVANYIERPEAVRALRDTLFAADGHRAVALTAVEGMGGIGKTVLAQALFRDEVMREAFPDGLVWITVGREATRDVGARLREIVRVLGGGGDEAVAAETLYRTTIAGKAALIVIDDMWSKADLDPFLAESARSRFLFTTRDASIARFSGDREHRVNLLGEAQARELLAAWAGEDVGQLPRAAEDVLRECGGLPLALSTVGAMLAGSTAAEWSDTAGLLRNADLGAIEDQLPTGQGEFFPRDRREREGAGAEDAGAVWEVGRSAGGHGGGAAGSGDALELRGGRGAADRAAAGGSVSGAAGWAEWDSVARFAVGLCTSPVGDREALELIRGAVRLSAHVVEKDAGQFASQVVGRLLPYRDVPAIREFIDEIAAGAPRPWLRPLHPALHPPGTPLLRTLEGHSGSVNGVAVTPDGKRAVSASWDKTLKVWDLETGRALRTLEGHGDHVLERGGDAGREAGGFRVCGPHAEGVGPGDGPRAAHVEGHSGAVSGVAVTPDGKRAVSASSDKTLKVWDLETGRALRTLEGHSAHVSGVAVTPDGRRAVSASWDKTLKVWDLDTGARCARWKATLHSVHGVAVTPDGKRAVSASGDRTLKVWDLDDRPRAAHAGRPLWLGLRRGSDARRKVRGFRV